MHSFSIRTYCFHAEIASARWKCSVFYRVFILNRPLQTVVEQERGGSVKNEDPIFFICCSSFVVVVYSPKFWLGIVLNSSRFETTAKAPEDNDKAKL